jgi:hypothetical protein
MTAMKRGYRLLTSLVCLGGISALAGCNDPTHFDASPATTDMVPPPPEEICPAHPEWLPNTPEFQTDAKSFYKPAPHPETECPFYSAAWQNFLFATQPLSDTDGTPAIKTYPTIDDIFTKVQALPANVLAPAGMPRGTPLRSWLGDIKQAGERQVAIDQNGHTLYFGIHTNQIFADFIKEQGLTTAKAVQEADPNLFFPPGMAEFKSAWQRIDDPKDADGFITTDAYVPHISVGTDPTTNQQVLIEDRDHTEHIQVRLLALHVVVTFPGHPEFLWGHFEHTTVDMSPTATESDFKAENGFRDVAPITPAVDGELRNPPDLHPNNEDITAPVNDKSFILYKGGTPTNQSDLAIPESDLVTEFDEASQTFKKSTGDIVQTSIYRIFPASKSNTTEPDAAISSLNHNVEALFRSTTLKPNDMRGHYRLAGAQWMDKPAFFSLNNPLQNTEDSPLIGTGGAGQVAANLDPVQAPDRQAALLAGSTGNADIIENGSDSAFSILAGEDRLSGMPLESFTQSNAFDNCFTCHNTQAIASNGVPYRSASNGRLLLPPKLMNVSHVLSQFVLEECDKPQYRVALGQLPATSTVKGLLISSGFSDMTALVAACPDQPAAQ